MGSLFLKDRNDHVFQCVSQLRIVDDEVYGRSLALGNEHPIPLVDADLDIAELTDIQVGSYCVMDAEYLAVEHGGPRYAAALRMITSVISSHHPGMATLDAGTKSLYVTPGAPPRVIDGNELRENWEYDWSFGDEHGRLTFPVTEKLNPGDRLELIVSHCDPTINLFDSLYVVKGEDVLDCWPIALRGCNR